METRPEDFPWLQAPEGSSKLPGPKGQRYFPSGVGTFYTSARQLLAEEPRGLGPRSYEPRSSQVTRRWSLPREGTGERSVQTSARQFIDGVPRLAAQLREVDGIDNLFSSLLFLLF